MADAIPTTSTPTGTSNASGAPDAGKVPDAGKTAPSAKPEGEGAPEKKTETVQERRKFKFNIGGKEVTREFNDTELELYLQKGMASDMSLKEAKALQRQIKEFVALGQKGDISEAIKKLWGVDPDEWAEKRLGEKLRRATMTDQERESLERKEESERLKKKVEEYETKEKTAAQKVYEEKVWQKTEADVMKALQDCGLERNHQTLHLIADVYEGALNDGIKLTPAQLVQEARERAKSYAKGTIFALKGDALLNELGTELVNEILRAEVQRRRGTTTNPTTQVKPPSAQKRPEPVENEEAPVSATRRRIARRFGLD